MGLIKSLLTGGLSPESEEVSQYTNKYFDFSGSYFLIKGFLGTQANSSDLQKSLLSKAAELLHSPFPDIPSLNIQLSEQYFALIVAASYATSYDSDFNEICRMFYNSTKTFLLLGISKTHSGIKDLSYSMDEASDALSIAYYDKKSVHSYAEYKSSPDTDHHSINRLFESLHGVLQTGNIQSSLLVLSDILTYESTNRLSKTDGERICETLWNICLRTFENTGLASANSLISLQDLIQKYKGCIFFDEAADLQRAMVSSAAVSINDALLSSGNIFINTQKYIESHFTEPISLNEISGAIGVNASYLSRFFKQKTGVTITDKITGLRINYAKELIKNTDKKMYEIAHEAGFEDTAYFSNVFKKYVGMSPKAYQDQKNF